MSPLVFVLYVRCRDSGVNAVWLNTAAPSALAQASGSRGGTGRACPAR
ncbi:hypothetical protein [Phaeobacter sp. HF9A]|nr:hypothetical protein [Phaeobacter sp. HF9A]NIZ15070.1 hypothetical protein [Phaeobacter sp. HF9A]